MLRPVAFRDGAEFTLDDLEEIEQKAEEDPMWGKPKIPIRSIPLFERKNGPLTPSNPETPEQSTLDKP